MCKKYGKKYDGCDIFCAFYLEMLRKTYKKNWLSAYANPLYLSLCSLRDFFVYFVVSAVFYRKEHEAGAKSTKIYTQFIQGLYIRIVI